MAAGILQSQAEPLNQTVLATMTAPQSERLLSLDGLRGFDMLWIIGGQLVIHGLAKAWPDRFWIGVSTQFEHVRWQGLHAFDVIWALFMFMVGVSLTFSLAKRKQMHESHGAIYAHAVKRAVLLSILGMILQGNLLQFNLSTFHPFYSVLHGIAAGYLIATIVTLNFKVKGQAITTAIFLVSYWILLLTIPVPGVGRGKLTPYGNAATYIDHLAFGRFSYVPLGQENTWLLSYLGFASSVLLGVLAGEFTSFQTQQKNEMSDALWLRRGLGGFGPHLEPLVSYHQVVVDQFLRISRRRNQLPVDGNLLFSDRCAWLSETGVSVYSDRDERIGRVYCNGAVRFS